MYAYVVRCSYHAEFNLNLLVWIFSHYNAGEINVRFDRANDQKIKVAESTNNNWLPKASTCFVNGVEILQFDVQGVLICVKALVFWLEMV